VTNHAVDLINGLAQVRSLEAGGAQGAQEGVEVEAVVEVVACDGVGISLRKLRGAQYGVDDAVAPAALQQRRLQWWSSLIVRSCFAIDMQHPLPPLPPHMYSAPLQTKLAGRVSIAVQIISETSSSSTQVQVQLNPEMPDL
jgi:hypothetical protein